MKYPNLFSPIKIGTLELKNRVVMVAMGNGMEADDGTPTEESIVYYEERARGGAGLIMVDATRVNDAHGRAAVHQFSLSSDDVIPNMKKFVDRIHQNGAKIMIQLNHPGRETSAMFMADGMVVAPSAIPSVVYQQPTRSLELSEIKSLIGDYAAAARRAKLAGFDGVEVHAAHGYLINQFLSPYSNKRTDEYGGSFDNRMRILEEIVIAIRQECGNDYPILSRIPGDEFLGEKGLQLEDGIKIAKRLEEIGIDAIDVSCGTYESSNFSNEPTSFDEGWKKYMHAAIKKNVSVPVIGVTVIRSPETAESLIAEGSLDLAGVGKGHLADPEWSNKAFEGRSDEIRRCISCLHCMDTALKGTVTGEPFECSINARMARETIYPSLNITGEGRVVVIVGAGPSGLEAARVLALRGFKPIIFEKEAEIGGQLQYANKTPHKDKINWLIDYYKVQLEKLGVEIHLGVEADEKQIKELSPYAVFIATGSNPIVPRSIEGITNSNVYQVPSILRREVVLKNKTVAVIGSGMTGLETAEYLVADGNKVVVVEMLDNIGNGIYGQNLEDILEKLNAGDVKFLPGHQLISVDNTSILLRATATKEEISIPVDAVVLSLGVISNNKLYQQIKDTSDLSVTAIGDAGNVGQIANAVHTGFRASYNL